MDAVKSWFHQNQALVYFLIAQATAILFAVGSIIAYSAQLETRVHTMEIRGSPHLAVIDNRIAVLEAQIKENAARIDRVVEVMTRELNKPRQ